MDGVEEEVSQSGFEPAPDCKIVEIFGTPNGDGTSLVRQDFFNNGDPRAITQLFVCPFCQAKLGFKGRLKEK